jgi:hypothetical protein
LLIAIASNAKPYQRCQCENARPMRYRGIAGPPRDLVEAIHSAAAEVFATVFHDGGIGSVPPWDPLSPV